MKILLSNPPWSKKGFYAVRAGSRWPHFEAESMQYMPFPFFMAHACSWLEEHGYKPKNTKNISKNSTAQYITAKNAKYKTKY